MITDDLTFTILTELVRNIKPLLP